ncbi:hypothetical protein OOZ51_14315 [Arthrobacter sp. MI7-26]|uniref:competence protein CoiA family protein n=1 Tax=Arthrobacter sp. MI7-26 TaxID=2993653 RepID=UPI0022496D32|nr:hypothetical protein [Arthrobacter sp. MI7-26]MCX2748979.1 hypothetical protein [Arthrobacter sp. MI7-26]
MAYLEGERVDATETTHDPWRALVNHPLYESLVLLECGLRASRVTRRGRQFFKHYPGVACSVEHKSESDQHLAMKQALKDRINLAPDWRAEVEHAHPRRAWIADVMAIHSSGKRLAFEVQLSPQNEDEYIRRSQLYADDGVGAVWVVPGSPEWSRVRVPMIVTGFGKTSDLAGAPGWLMDPAHYQPMFSKRVTVGAAVDAVLHPAFHWPYGTPKHQLEAIASLEQMKAKAAAKNQARAAQLAEAKRLAEEKAAVEAVQLAEAKRLAEEKAAVEAAKVQARFTESATAPTAAGVRPVLAYRRIWASEVRCMGAGHPMLIWRLTQPTPSFGDAAHRWMPRSENFANIRGSVDAWLAAAAIGVAKAGIHRLQGLGDRRAYACPECKDLIKGRWVAALPPEKWSVIAEASVASAEARDVLYQRPQTGPTSTEMKPQAVVRTSNISEGDFRFTGPKRRPYWIQDAQSGREIAEHQASKDAMAERMHAIRDNPRYRARPDGFRFDCTDCGGMFEDDKEGRHADGGCLIRDTRSLGPW